MRPPDFAAIFIFALLWCYGIGVLNYTVGREVIGQWRALSFLETTGTVSASSVRSKFSKAGVKYEVDVVYSYSVSGLPYEGKRMCFGYWGTSGGNAPHAWVRRHPSGSTVPVYYNPRNPSDAVLERGIDGGLLFPLIFLTPFNVLTLIFFRNPVLAIGRWIRKPEAGGIPIFRDGPITRLRLPAVPPVLAGMAALAAANFIAIFIIGFGFRLNASVPTVIAIWTFDLAIGGAVYFWPRKKVLSGNEDLVLDAAARTVSLPMTNGVKVPLVLPLENIIEIVVVQSIRAGRGNMGSFFYELHFNTVHGNRKITEFSSEARARLLAQWLVQTLRIPISNSFIAR